VYGVEIPNVLKFLIVGLLSIALVLDIFFFVVLEVLSVFLLVRVLLSLILSLDSRLFVSVLSIDEVCRVVFSGPIPHGLVVSHDSLSRRRKM
jgi:hypothetical protein